MKDVHLLDCTLRDGGRIIDCKFEDATIRDLSEDLTEAGIEIIELGFLRDKRSVEYKGNSTFFTDIKQLDRFAIDPKKSLYTVFIDYGMYDFSDLADSTDSKVKGIRVGFTKKNFITERNEIIHSLKCVKEKGYKLFVQGVNTPGYSDKELLEIVDIVNDINPYSFGIVDTYGSLYLEDLTHVYNLVEYNLNGGIHIDIHSHNNFQSSFAFAQEVLRVASDDRVIILDSTLNGMGKVAGNLNTELIVDYLNRKKGKKYDLDTILDCIDRYLAPIRTDKTWGYSIPAFMAGIYKSHPNNVIYLTEKYRLGSRDIKNIISAIDEEKRQRYDYENIQRIYREYGAMEMDDSDTLKKLRSIFQDKRIIVLAPGKSVVTHVDDIRKNITENDIVIGVNFIPESIDLNYLFCASPLHWGRLKKKISSDRCILTSNVKDNIDGTYYVNYSSYLSTSDKLSDNSTMMLLNLIKACNVHDILLAGFDGMKSGSDNYASNAFVNTMHGLSVEETNDEIKTMFMTYMNDNKASINISFLTPSIYSDGIH